MVFISYPHLILLISGQTFQITVAHEIFLGTKRTLKNKLFCHAFPVDSKTTVARKRIRSFPHPHPEKGEPIVHFDSTSKHTGRTSRGLKKKWQQSSRVPSLMTHQYTHGARRTADLTWFRSFRARQPPGRHGHTAAPPQPGGACAHASRAAPHAQALADTGQDAAAGLPAARLRLRLRAAALGRGHGRPRPRESDEALLPRTPTCTGQGPSLRLGSSGSRRHALAGPVHRPAHGENARAPFASNGEGEAT